MRRPAFGRTILSVKPAPRLAGISTSTTTSVRIPALTSGCRPPDETFFNTLPMAVEHEFSLPCLPLRRAPYAHPRPHQTRQPVTKPAGSHLSLAAKRFGQSRSRMSNRCRLDGEAWKAIEPLIPLSSPRAEAWGTRPVIHGPLHLLKIGCRWIDCPRGYRLVATVCMRFNQG